MAASAQKSRSRVGAREPKVAPTAPKSLSYLTIYRASPADRIRIIKEGVPASNAKRMSADLHLEQGAFLEALNLKTATVNRKASRNETLSLEDGERVIGIAKLMGQLEAMLEETGDPEKLGGPDRFDAPRWLSNWLREPLAALGGLRPIGLLDTMEGQALVSKVLSQMQSGAYA